MPKLHVLVASDGRVLGTLRQNGPGTGPQAPASIGMRTREGQRLLELEVDEATLSLSPEELHKALEREHVAR